MDQQNTKPTTDSGTDIVVLKFADSKVPVFKEVRNKDYILYGEDNLYPEYLTKLYNKSAKHNAIINGKVNYIFGNGLNRRSGQVNESKPVNRLGETQSDITKRAIRDLEIYGGYRYLIIWDTLGNSFERYHLDFHKVRAGKDGGFWYKEDWTDSREQAKFYPEFDPKHREGAQVFCFNEYRPGCKIYPLPGYIAANNYIETDIEISKYNLSMITNGMMLSKMIQFFDGVPPEEKQREVEKKWEKKFTGSENGGRFVLVFSPNKEKAIQIDDLSSTDSDKLFIELNKTCQQEIFTGHQVVSPMLFGIKTEGQLGGNTELKTAYEIFINTYAKPKQQDIESTENYFDRLLGGAGDFYTEQLDPIGLQIDISSIMDKLPAKFLFEKLNIPKEYWPAEAQMTGEEGVVNDALKNLTGRQLQNIQRIVRRYSKGEITRVQAISLLKAGFNFTDQDCIDWLGEDDAAQFASDVEDNIIEVFSEFGDSKSNYTAIKRKAVKFSTLEEAFEDEYTTKQAFKELTGDLTGDILTLITRDKRMTPETIAETLQVEVSQVNTRIESLIEKGLIQSNPVTVGTDTQVERTLTKPLPEIKKDLGIDAGGVQITVKYSYEGPSDSKNRPFCKRMLELDRYYSRYEIEKISERLGYSVFDRRGGFWNKGNGVVSPSCRHKWESHVVVKKGGSK